MNNRANLHGSKQKKNIINKYFYTKYAAIVAKKAGSFEAL